MKISSFRDLIVYGRARELAEEIYGITKQDLFSKDYGLAGQIQRASASITSNIAEGFERGSNKEFTQFLYIAKGSCGEVGSQIDIAFDRKYIDGNVYKILTEKCRLISIMLNNLIKYLKTTGISKRNK